MPEPIVTLHKVGLNELPTAAVKIKEALPASLSVVCFQGEMGAGKTTFIKELCAAFGVTELVTSPTYSLVNEYEGSNGRRICHFDFYRIRNEAEAEDIGVTEYFNTADLCLVEWPSEIPSLLPDQYAEVLIETNEKAERTISLTIY